MASLPESSGVPPAAMAQGPPYMPQNANLGGTPTTTVDVPISSVIIFLFIVGAVSHMTILQLNLRRGHKFILSGVVFGFCMARISANVMRIAWACYPRNINIAIAANVLSNAGVLLLFVVNLIFAQRMLRAYQPRLGWSRPLRLLFVAIYISVVACLVLLVVAVVYSSFTLNQNILRQLHDAQLFATTFLAFLAFLPVPLTASAVLLPREGPIDKFGSGRMRTKVILLVFTALLLSLGAGFRTGVTYDRRPLNNPGWFHSRPCYYCFNYLIELIVVFTYLVTRFDRRFHVPNGSNRPGDYSHQALPATGKLAAKNVGKS